MKGQLPSEYVEELNLLEQCEIRTSLLCNELGLNDIHLSWSELCCIISPTNPSRIADRLFKHLNGFDIHKDVCYQEIYEAIEKIGSEDQKFWNCDVLWVSSIAEIVYRYFRDIWWYLVEEMEIVHEKLPSLDLNKVFFEAVLVMKERDEDLDRLFNCKMN